MEKLFILVPVLYLVIEAVRGYRKGLVLSILSLVSWVISFGGSALLVREFLTKSGKLPEITAFFTGFTSEDRAGKLVLVTLFVLMAIILKLFCLIIMHFAEKIGDIPVIGELDRILGAVFGILKGLLVFVLAFLAYAIYSGFYLDVIYSQFPQLKMIVDVVTEYVRNIWYMLQ